MRWVHGGGRRAFLGDRHDEPSNSADVLRRSTGSALASDQFVYWNASKPSRSLSPDAFVKLGVPRQVVDSWKTWQRGAPEVAVEIMSASIRESRNGRRNQARLDGERSRDAAADARRVAEAARNQAEERAAQLLAELETLKKR